jgi:hypothetical protein
MLFILCCCYYCCIVIHLQIAKLKAQIAQYKSQAPQREELESAVTEVATLKKSLATARSEVSSKCYRCNRSVRMMQRSFRIGTLHCVRSSMREHDEAVG